MSGPGSLGELRLLAPAKLNLILRVLGKRDDGFHEIDSWFLAVDLFDEVRLRRRVEPGIEFACRGDQSVPGDESNLAYRAASRFLERWAPEAGVSVELEKRIPSGAGLGGGSSDAATVLKGLSQIFPGKAEEEELSQLGAELGSDVPFFLAPTGCAVCRGRGEIVEELSWDRPLVFVVLVSDQPVSTAAVYENFTSCLTGGNRHNSLELEVARLLKCKDIGPFLRNDLEPSAFSLFPSLRRICHEFQELAQPRRVLLTGSGCGLFALCLTRDEADRLSTRLRARHLGRTFVVESATPPPGRI